MKITTSFQELKKNVFDSLELPSLLLCETIKWLNSILIPMTSPNVDKTWAKLCGNSYIKTLVCYSILIHHGPTFFSHS